MGIDGMAMYLFPVHTLQGLYIIVYYLLWNLLYCRTWELSFFLTRDDNGVIMVFIVEI